MHSAHNFFFAKKFPLIENPSSAAASSTPLPPPPTFQFQFSSVFSSLDGSIADGVTMVPSSEGSSNAVMPSSSTKKPKQFKIKKWNAIAFWAWGLGFWMRGSGADAGEDQEWR